MKNINNVELSSLVFYDTRDKMWFSSLNEHLINNIL